MKLLTCLWLTLCIAEPAFGHGKATERYIPIGHSPDSGRYTLQGTLDAVDGKARAIRIRAGTARHTILITDDTALWLDRSKLEMTNLLLRFDQLAVGTHVEARCANSACTDGASAV